MNRANSERGFALIDAMLAIFVLSTGLVAAIDLIVSTQVEIDYMRKASMSAILAQSKIEELDAEDAVPSSSSGNFGTDYGLSAYNGLSYTVTVSALPAVGYSPDGTTTIASSNASKVVVSVSFNDMRGKSHSVVLSSIKAKRI